MERDLSLPPGIARSRHGDVGPQQALEPCVHCLDFFSEAGESDIGPRLVYLLDARTPDPSGRVPPHDIIGAFDVRDGALVTGSYRHAPGTGCSPRTDGSVSHPPSKPRSSHASAPGETDTDPARTDTHGRIAARANRREALGPAPGPR
jgi:hypothetical protein